MTAAIAWPGLREQLKRRGLTQADVAAACGVHASIVGLWVRGSRPVAARHVATLTALLGICRPDKPCGYCQRTEGGKCRRHGRPPVHVGPRTGEIHVLWSPAEKLLVRRDVEAGALSRVIQQHLAAELHSHRSRYAIGCEVQRQELRMLGPADVFSQQQLARMFGVRAATVRQWTQAGLLDGRHVSRRHGGRGPRGQWQYSLAAVESFMRTHPWAFDAQEVAKRCRNKRLASLAEVSARADLWLRLDAAAVALHVSRDTLGTYVARGLVPHRRRIAGAGSAKVMIRARDIPSIAEIIQQEADRGRANGYERRAARSTERKAA
jgi:DNA-binding transcriptional regulator YiaG